MKRTMTSISTGLVAVVLLAGCASGDSSGGGDTTLQLTWQAGQEAAVDPVIAAFEKANPGVTVDVQYLPVDTYGQVVQTRFQSGNGPDLVWGSPGTGNPNALGLLEEQGNLVDLADESFADSVPDITGLRNGDVLYGIPVGVFPIGMAVNTTALEASGTTVPTTFDDLLEQCRTAAANGYSFVSLAGQGSGLGSLFLATLASQWVLGEDPGWIDQRLAGDTTFAETPGWKTTIDRYLAMKDAECYPKGVASMDTGQQISDLASGKSVTGVVPADAIVQIAGSAPDAEFEMYPFPGDSEATTFLPISFGQGLGVNKASKHVDQAVAFVEFLQQPENQRMLADGLGAVSLGDYNDGKLTGIIASLSDTIASGQTVAYMPLQFPNPDVLTVLGNDVTGLLTGQTSADAALTNLDAAWDKN
jgi:raffinose/stachyose/melibiose transport system substrate-binding protein